MTPKQFVETQMRLIEIGKIADSLNLDDFLKAVTNAENATLGLQTEKEYAIASLNLAHIRRLAEVVQPVKIIYAETYKPMFRGSSVVEQSAVNRSVAGSTPAPEAKKS